MYSLKKYPIGAKKLGTLLLLRYWLTFEEKSVSKSHTELLQYAEEKDEIIIGQRI